MFDCLRKETKIKQTTFGNKRIDDRNHTIFIFSVSSVSRGRSRSSEESFVQVFFITSRESQKRTSRIVDVHKSVLLSAWFIVLRRRKRRLNRYKHFCILFQ